ncbi:hypothetical protein [Mesobaculum littorinae]|uniref:hypothetical protein n=1 Tax=Mesobaculum littorinae TaxID=2486419 RepID=UPI0013E2ED70|nr:hypothetical protein [Mesobaculum littorinae]
MTRLTAAAIAAAGPGTAASGQGRNPHRPGHAAPGILAAPGAEGAERPTRGDRP